MALLDASVLLHFLEDGVPAPRDPASGEEIPNAKARIEQLIATLQAKGEAIVIPTPALSEVLVHADEAGSRYLELLNSTRCVRIVAFGERAAVELAAITKAALSEGARNFRSTSTRAKLKFDRQIVAIALVEGESTIYSDDEDILKLGGRHRLTVIRTTDLAAPPASQRQLELPGQN